MSISTLSRHFGAETKTKTKGLIVQFFRYKKKSTYSDLFELTPPYGQIKKEDIDLMAKNFSHVKILADFLTVY